jgi:hypothetical protein
MAELTPLLIDGKLSGLMISITSMLRSAPRLRPGFHPPHYYLAANR